MTVVPLLRLRQSPCLILLYLSLLLAGGEMVPPPSNEEILIDSIQINPGDPVGHQGSKYTDMRYLKSLGYTARSSSMEQSPALCLDYKNADRVPPGGAFAEDRNSLAWADAYSQGMDWMIEETGDAGLEMFFFTDMIVFPAALLRLYPEVVRVNTTTTIVWNNWTEYLLTTMFDEWFERFPGTQGIVVRTGETYTFDTPYHAGSSPIAGIGNVTEQQDVWVRFIDLLRNVVCVKYGRKVIFRTWFSILGVDYYSNVTARVQPHELLYFSVKHTTGDFFRQMAFNDMLGIGQHAQIVEVQIQREYEGKGAYPLYIFEHVVLGDESTGSSKSLSGLFPGGRNESSLVKGLWTWSRGGGWWGPYIHGAEFWIDLNLNLFVSWWQSNCTTTSANVDDIFQAACEKSLLGGPHPAGASYPLSTRLNTTESGRLDGACKSLHAAARIADRALLYGRYCLETGHGSYGACWIWTRDDRIGGLDELGSHLQYLRGNSTRMASSLWLKGQSLVLWEQAFSLYLADVAPTVAKANSRLDRQIRSSFLYARSYFCVIESGWRALIYGVLLENANFMNSRLFLHAAIFDYDACWSVFRASALATSEFPSLYKGVSWNFPFEGVQEGMDAAMDKLRLLPWTTDFPTDELLPFLGDPAHLVDE